MTAQRSVLDLPTDVQTVDGWRGVLAGLAREEGELEAALDAVRAERRERAMDIARGVPAAVKRNEELNRRQTECMSNLDLLLVVRGVAQEKLAEAEASEAAATAAAKLGRLREGMEAAKRLAAEADAAAAKLGDALGAFRAAVNGMLADGLDSARANKLRNRTKLLGALHAAGLGGHLALDRVPASHQETLTGWTGRILAGQLGEGTPADAGPVQVGPYTVKPAAPAAEYDPAVRG